MNEYEVICGLETFRIAAEDERQAGILTAHSNNKPVKKISSIRYIGPTTEAFIQKIK